VSHLLLCAVLVTQGRWHTLTRRIDIAMSVAVSAVLAWSISAGHVFQGEASDGIARQAG
jgi:hypothetical protein